MAGERVWFSVRPPQRAKELLSFQATVNQKAMGWGEGLTSLVISGVTTGQEPSQKGRDVIMSSRDEISTRAEEGGDDVYIGHLKDTE